MDKKKRLNINFTEEEYKEIKHRAVDRGISLTVWVKRAIQEAINREKKYE